MARVDKPQSSAAEIRASMGDVLDKIDVFHNQILIGIYMRGTSKVLPNGQVLYIPDQAAQEDQWQGKTGLVLKKGALAFVNDARNDFKEQDVAAGDWILFRVSDGFPLDVNGVHCRLIEDIHIKGRISAPDIIW